MRPDKLFIVVAILSFTAATALAAQAPPSQVINGTGRVVTQSPVFLLPDANRTPLKVLPVGTSVDVLVREGDWYQIVFHDSPLGDRQGYMRVANIRLEVAPPPRQPTATGVPRAPATSSAAPPQGVGPPQAAPPPPARQQVPKATTSWLSRAYVSLNGNYQTTSSSFAAVSTFTQYAETGTRTASYAVGRAPGLDVGGGVRIWRELEVGAAVTKMSQSRDGAVSASIPHPFFFNAFRDVSGTTAAVPREELVVHGDVTWEIAMSRDSQIAVFGGPSYFRVTQGLVTAVTVNDVYPFDTATFTGATTTESAESRLGFNVGVDFTTLFTKTVGVGVLARYSRASLQFPVNGSNLTVQAGGLQVGAGVRLRF